MSERVLSSRFRLVERLGAGGMGVVWRAEDLVLHREVAVKTVAGPAVTDEGAARLEREARAVAGLSDCPQVVTVHDFGRDGDTFFIVMALAEGRPLDRVLASDGPPSPARAVDWTRQVCAALAVAHERGIVHRDIKPANVMLASDGTVRVLDFGIAWFHPDLGLDRLSQVGGALGSAPWMSPEQARGKDVGPPSDLYSLGCLLYQLLTGQLPFGDRDGISQLVAHATETPDRPSAHRPGLPDELDRLVAELLAKSPESRPPSAVDTAARLGSVAQLLGGKATAAHTPTFSATAPEPEAERPVRRRGMQRRTLLLSALGLAAVSTTAVVVPRMLQDASAGDSDAGTLKPLWKRPLTGSVVPISGPVVLVSGDESAVAYDRRTGEVRWTSKDAFTGEYRLSNSTWYVTVDSGELRALNPETGKSRWSFNSGSEPEVSGDTLPVLTSERVYVGRGSRVYALEHDTGEKRWSYEHTDDSTVVTFLGMATGMLLARSKEYIWAAISQDDGQHLWTLESDRSEFLIYEGEIDGRLFFWGTGNHLSVIDAKTGKVIDTYEDFPEVLVVPEHKLLLSSGSLPGDRAALHAWSAANGEQLWSVPRVAFSAVFGDIAVVTKAEDNEMVFAGLDIQTGMERWRNTGLPSSLSNVKDAAANREPLILMVSAEGGAVDKGTHLVHVDVQTGAHGPALSLPDEELMGVWCLGDTVYVDCADASTPQDGSEDGPSKSHLYAVALADLK
ncbi:PQQ-binding-like beta-propeller repeat protein [Streptomyces sp. ATexAB-D23]|uniref:serine/threonine-protein kinase n=1 Tax=unclassified Streptomyces TaxID=2593676 RepID=UPI0003AA1323|nr:PQQ-binding-like beta-propeller repeat protein [Streptomyces sp. ATexAB-D23]MYY03340.1 PQQ-binding-like beta-propeller repeat protein [Streptomyces sp. SID4913]